VEIRVDKRVSVRLNRTWQHNVTKPAKRHLVTFLKIAAAIAILAWLFYDAQRNKEFENFLAREKQWTWIVIGFAATVLAHVIGFLRWRIMVRALELPFTIMDAIRIGFIGVLFNTVSIGVIGGDALRAFYVTRQIKDRKPEAISSVIADRIIGLLTMFTIASTMFLLNDFSTIAGDDEKTILALKTVFRFVLVCTVLGYAGVATVFCAPWICKTNWYQSLFRIPKIGGLIERLTNVVLVYRSRPGVVAVSFLLSLGVNACFVVAIYSLGIGLTDNYPSLLDHCVIEPIAMVSGAAPTPAGIGAMEWALSFLYKAFGSTSGIIVAFGFRLALIFVALIGAGFWFKNKSSLSDAIEDDTVN